MLYAIKLGQGVMNGFFRYTHVLTAEHRNTVFKQRKLFPVLMNRDAAIAGFAVISQLSCGRRQRCFFPENTSGQDDDDLCHRL